MEVKWVDATPESLQSNIIPPPIIKTSPEQLKIYMNYTGIQNKEEMLGIKNRVSVDNQGFLFDPKIKF